MRRTVAIAQGTYYVATGVWPLLDLYSFELVSGPKTDDWLVKTVGVLITVVGFVLFSAGLKRQVSMPIVMLAVGSASVLAAIEFYYAMRGVIWPIYLLDGVAELVLIAWWMVAVLRDRGATTTRTATRHA